MQRVCIKVTGKVQGVNFRWSTREKAEQLGLTGYVKNESDGSVYLEAEGPEDQLDELIDWCRKGPERAHVTDVIVNKNNPVSFLSFEIKR